MERHTGVRERSRLDPLAIAVWCSFVLAPLGVYATARLSATAFWPTVAVTAFVALALPAAAGRQRTVGRVAVARWLVVAAVALTLGTLLGHGLSAPVAVTAAGVLAVVLLDSPDYRRVVATPR
jgi:hypothetical protein